MRIIQCEQGTPEWWEAKRGIPSASNFHKILTPKTMKPSASQEEYIHELIGDAVQLSPNYFTSRGSPVTPDMQHGIDTEKEARSWYAMQEEMPVTRVGFVMSDCGHLGCSPDALVGEEGGLELKCPQPKTQAGYLLAGELPSDYRCQVHGSLIVTGRKWWDFCSYCPGLPALVLRIVPDDFTVKLSEELTKFLKKYNEAKTRINDLMRKRQT